MMWEIFSSTFGAVFGMLVGIWAGLVVILLTLLLLLWILFGFSVAGERIVNLRKPPAVKPEPPTAPPAKR